MDEIDGVTEIIMTNHCVLETKNKKKGRHIETFEQFALGRLDRLRTLFLFGYFRPEGRNVK